MHSEPLSLFQRFCYRLKPVKSLNTIEHKVNEFTFDKIDGENALFHDKALDKDVFLARKTLKKLKKSWVIKVLPEKQKIVAKLERKLTSIMIGGEVTVEMLEDNPEYERFIRDSRFHMAAKVYNLALPVINGQPGLIFEGKQISYEEAKEKKWDNGDPIIEEGGKNSGAVVTKDGLVKHYPFWWDEMISHDKNNSNDYAIEIMTAVKDPNEEKPQFLGDHTWLRLKNREGECFSWGVYGNDYPFLEYLKLRLGQANESCTDNPDRYETVDRNEYNVHGTTIKIDQEKYHLIREEIERFSCRKAPFSFLKTNCTGMVIHILAKAGIELEAAMTPSEFVSRKLFSAKVRKKAKEVIPKCISNALRAVFNFFGKLILFIAGSGYQDPSVKQDWENEFDDSIFKLKDIFKPYSFNHPLALRKWQRAQEAS